MKFATTEIGGGVEILASKDFQAIPVKVATPGSGSHVVCYDEVIAQTHLIRIIYRAGHTAELFIFLKDMT